MPEDLWPQLVECAEEYMVEGDFNHVTGHPRLIMQLTPGRTILLNALAKES